MFRNKKSMEKESEKKGIFLPIIFLFQRFEFTLTEEVCFMLGFCAASSRKYHKIFSFMEENRNITSPSLELCQDLIDMLEIGNLNEKTINLLNSQDDIKYLIFGLGAQENKNKNWLNKNLFIDSRILAFINQISYLPSELEDCLKIDY